jgi:hypothetical protein
VPRHTARPYDVIFSTKENIPRLQAIRNRPLIISGFLFQLSMVHSRKYVLLTRPIVSCTIRNIRAPYWTALQRLSAFVCEHYPLAKREINTAERDERVRKVLMLADHIQTGPQSMSTWVLSLDKVVGAWSRPLNVIYCEVKDDWSYTFSPKWFLSVHSEKPHWV